MEVRGQAAQEPWTRRGQFPALHYVVGVAENPVWAGRAELASDGSQCPPHIGHPTLAGTDAG